MKAVLVNIINPGEVGGLSQCRLAIGDRMYKIKSIDSDLLAIRRGGQWEYYRPTSVQFQYEKVGSTQHLEQ